jgi:hypothetical protein
VSVTRLQSSKQAAGLQTVYVRRELVCACVEIHTYTTTYTIIQVKVKFTL